MHKNVRKLCVFVYLKALVFCVDGRKVLKLKMLREKKKI